MGRDDSEQRLQAADPRRITALTKIRSPGPGASDSRRILDIRSLLRSDVCIEEEIHAVFHDISLLHRIIDRLHES